MSGQTYYVKVIDANTISLTATQNGSVMALTAPTNGKAVQSLLVVALGGSTGTQTFTASAVSGNEIMAANHGFVTGQQVVYTAANQPIVGLASGQTCYVIVVDANHFELATSAANAAARIAIGLAIGSGPTAASGSQTVAALPDPIQAASNPSVGLDGTQSFTGQQTGITAAQKGVIVSAVSTENVKDFGVGVAISAGGGGTAVPVAGDWTDDYVTTLAYINDGAQINADTSQASAQQDVAVTAGHSYSALMVAGSLGFGTAGAVMPALARLYLEGVTQAYIQGDSTDATTVNARDSVTVTAQAQEDVISVAAGIGGGAGFAVAGSLSWVGMDLQTQANIEGPVIVLAGGNVLVGADDQTTVVNVGGSVSIGGGGAGIGGGGGVVIIDKQTTADVGGATVDALADGSDTVSGIPNGSGGTGTLQGVAVEATSAETVTNVGGSAGGASGVGVYGGVTVEKRRQRDLRDHFRRRTDQPAFFGRRRQPGGRRLGDQPDERLQLRRRPCACGRGRCRRRRGCRHDAQQHHRHHRRRHGRGRARGGVGQCPRRLDIPGSCGGGRRLGCRGHPPGRSSSTMSAAASMPTTRPTATATASSTAPMPRPTSPRLAVRRSATSSTRASRMTSRRWPLRFRCRPSIPRRPSMPQTTRSISVATTATRPASRSSTTPVAARRSAA